MKKSPFSIHPATRRFQIWKQVLLVVLLVAAVVYLHDGYFRTRKSALETYSDRQLLLASNIASDIQFRFDLVERVLNLWSTSHSIINVTAQGMIDMEHILLAHDRYISAVTRTDETGKIMYTVPMNESAIGADISYQDHVRLILDTEQPVLSSPFKAVQGYWTIAYHVPLFSKIGEFKGSLAALIPYHEMFRELFLELLPSGEIEPWLIGEDGTILFSVTEEYEGLHYSQAFCEDEGFLAVADTALSVESGYLIAECTPFQDPASPVSMLSSILSFEFQGTTWTIVLSVPENVIMRDISHMSNRWLAGMIAILLLALIYSTLKIRAWTSMSEERKWQDVAHLSDILSTAIEQAKEGVIVLDEKGNIIYANPAVASLVGYSRRNLFKPVDDLNFLKISPSLVEIEKAVLRQGLWTGRVHGVAEGNFSFKIDMTASSVIDESGTITNFIIVGRDVSIRAEMERRLHEKQKIEAIGQLAGGIAHDFNNLLVGILGYAELLKQRHQGDTEIESAADIIIAAVNRGSELTRQLLGYARQGKHQIARISMATCIRNVNALLRRTIDQRIDVTLDLEEDVFVRGDSAQIEQVILNLAVNAMDAMPDGGKLQFTLRRERVPSSVLGRNASEGMELAVLTASDTGSGIKKEHLDRIFEPFFTTKEEEGTGMGLATVFGIITNHGGWVDVDSASGKGATFRIYLPVDSGGFEQESPRPRTTGAVSRGAGGRILLVDDEYVVVSTTSELLSELGYDVVTAPNGHRAIEIFKENPGSIDVVILDLSMPEMDGKECYIQLRKIRQDVKVILFSGYSRDGRVQELIDLGVSAYIQKPFRLNEISSIIEKILR